MTQQYFNHILHFLLYASLVGCAIDNGIKGGIASSSTVSTSLTPINNLNKSTYTATGTCSISGLPVTIQETTCGIDENLTCSDGNWSKTLDLSSCADGPLTFIVSHSESSTTATVLKDVIPPAFELTYPDEDNKPVGYKLKLSGVCSTSDGDVQVTLSDSSNNSIDINTSCVGASFSTYIETSSLSTGSITLGVSQSDLADNTVTTSYTLNKTTAACDTLVNRQKNVAADLAGGSGTPTDPLIVCTADQLNEVRNSLNESYRLGNDIYFEEGDTNGDFNLDGSDSDYLTGLGWEPLGPTFTGDFDGNDFTINGLSINRPASDYIGLFQSTNSSIIKNLKLKDSNVTAQDRIGSLVGNTEASTLYNISCTNCTVLGNDYVGGLSGTLSYGGINDRIQISNSQVTGVTRVGGIFGDDFGAFSSGLIAKNTTVNGTNSVGGLFGMLRTHLVHSYAQDVTIAGQGTNIGAIVGDTNSYAQISHTYATGLVYSTIGDRVGCLIGNLDSGDIHHSFAACDRVEGFSGAGNIGPVVGRNNAGTLNDVYYSGELDCIDAFPTCNSDGSLIATNALFFDQSQAHFNNWDFLGESNDGTNEFWIERTGNFPTLYFEETIPNYTSPLAGAGTQASPYQINSTADLQEVGDKTFYQNSYFQVMNNIDFTATPSFNGIFRTIPFYGNFNGGDFTMQNLNLTDDKDNLGFFGVMGQYSTATNLTLDLATFNHTGAFSGALAGTAITKGTTNKIRVTGAQISSFAIAGGIFGYAGAGNITQSEGHVDVTCTSDYCGGLVGELGTAGIQDSYAVGNVSGNAAIGGLVGTVLIGNVTRNYASGDVTCADGYCGGFIGATWFTKAHNFSTGTVTGSSASDDVGHFVGAGASAPVTDHYAGTCSNSGAGPCNTKGTSQALLSYFGDPLNAPMNGVWDFTTVWQSNDPALPTLRP